MQANSDDIKVAKYEYVSNTHLAPASTIASLIVALLIMMQWGIPFIMLGIPPWLTSQFMTISIFAFACLRVVSIGKYGKLTVAEIAIVLILAYCYFVTIIANKFIFRLPISDWMTSVAYIFPLLLILAAKPLRITACDILNGFVIACFLASCVAIADYLSPISALDALASRSTISSTGRRLVLMHNESAFAIGILISRLTQVKSIYQAKFLLMALSAICFSLLVISESRLAVGASAIGSLAFFLIFFKGKWKLPIAGVVAIAALLALPYIYDRYIVSLVYVLDGGFEKLASIEASTNFRKTEIAHFGRHFEETHGLGFGLMTISPNKNNFLSMSMFSLSALYNVDYQMSMIDVRIYSALFQFGYVGLLIVIWLTFITAKTNFAIAYRGRHPQRQALAAVGCVMMGFMLSPLPANLFTGENTILIGGLLYALTFLGLQEEKTRPHSSCNHVQIYRRGQPPL